MHPDIVNANTEWWSSLSPLLLTFRFLVLLQSTQTQDKATEHPAVESVQITLRIPTHSTRLFHSQLLQSASPRLCPGCSRKPLHPVSCNTYIIGGSRSDNTFKFQRCAPSLNLPWTLATSLRKPLLQSKVSSQVQINTLQVEARRSRTSLEHFCYIAKFLRAPWTSRLRALRLLFPLLPKVPGASAELGWIARWHRILKSGVHSLSLHEAKHCYRACFFSPAVDCNDLSA